MKFLSTLLFTFFLYFTSFSQGFHFGIGAGANYTNLEVSGRHGFNYDYAMGYQINALTEYKFFDQLGLRIEPGIESRRIGATFLGRDYKYHLNYLNLPIMLAFSPVKKLTLMGGFEWIYLLSTHVKPKGEPKQDLNNLFDQDFNFGLKAGISYHITDNFELALKYFKAIQPMKTFDTTDVDGNFAGRHSIYYTGFSLSVFYRI